MKTEITSILSTKDGRTYHSVTNTFPGGAEDRGIGINPDDGFVIIETKRNTFVYIPVDQVKEIIIQKVEVEG